MTALRTASATGSAKASPGRASQPFPAATARAGIRANGVRDMAKAAAHGATMHELSPEARARWVAATLPVHRRLIDAAGGRSQELYDLVMRGKKAFAERLETGDSEGRARP